MEYAVRTGTMTIAVSGTSSSTTEVIKGDLGHLVVQVPALTGTGTITVRGTNNHGGTIYALGTVLESNSGVIAPVNYPTYFNGTLGIAIEETSGTQAAAADVIYDLYYRAKHG